MPPLNWDVFVGLPGSIEINFEMLCRALIRKNYGRYGAFAALAAQPGVEFHLRLDKSCTLGEPGRWYGWQCRWYDLPGGRAIGNTRRKKIMGAITTTEKELPELTDWVLWTRRPLTKSDQEWFYKIKTRMKLNLWTAAEVEDHINGEALILRSTYFGELILTPEIAAKLHDVAVAPIRRRWQPKVHQTIDAERTLQRMLGETNIWNDLKEASDQLEIDIAAINIDLKDLTNPIVDSASELVDLACLMVVFLRDTYTALTSGDLDLLMRQLASCPTPPTPDMLILPRRLRALGEPASLSTTNTLSGIHKALSLADDAKKFLTSQLVVIIADAGCGKTQLAAQLTSATDNRPAGILLHGRDLYAGHNLDDLAHRVEIRPGQPVPAMEALIAAVDAAGQRAQHRLPIIIDGLNEAEDPRIWKHELASLQVVLRQYPYVLVICTLRTAFAKDALPPEIDRLEMPGFGNDAFDAIRLYFSYYRITAVDTDGLPLELLSHPLTLRLFCEVTNPKREQDVSIDAAPKSLTALFERYLEQAVERIAELAPRSQRYYEQDIRAALDEFGMSLWSQKARSIDEFDLRQQLRDSGRPWGESMIFAMEQEGIVLRVPGEVPGKYRIMAVYDSFAGYLIASAILSNYGRSSFEVWLRNPETLVALAGPLANQHPLATDTFNALVALVPRRLHRQQLWPLLDEPLRTTAIQTAADLDGTYLDAATVNELAELITQTPKIGALDLLDRLRNVRGIPSHPLNAKFLDSVLTPMTVANRDLRWTEWIRRNGAMILADLRRLERRWQKIPERTATEQLRAKWVMWTLTSTVREIRDQATRTLYWYSRIEPANLFNLTIDALAINDAYVPERMLAASYGVAMAHQLHEPGFADVLSSYLAKLCAALTGSGATHPTYHYLSRLYVQGVVDLARTYYQGSLPDELETSEKIAFAPSILIEPIASEDPRATEVNETLNIDFENYTLGQLFNDRRNYDMDHKGHQSAAAYVRGMVWELGWRESSFGTIDKDLYRYANREDGAKTERYGKKYSWIGYYKYAGILADQGKLPLDERLSHIQIDPSFPESPQSAPVELASWATPSQADTRQWIRHGTIKIPDSLLYRSELDKRQGPWIAVDGYLTAENQVSGRRVFGLLSVYLVAAADADRLVGALNTSGHPSWSRLPETPSDYYTFAGEIPWSPDFARSSGSEPDSTALYHAAIRIDDDSQIDVETMAHHYAWESYHSLLNNAGGADIPSRPFSVMFDLRGIPQSFCQVLPDGSFAALTFLAPNGYKGHLLYLREDLVYKYAAGRKLIWFIWGERQLNPHPQPTPDWLILAQRKNENVWRRVVRGEDLSNAFAGRRSRQRQ